VEPAVWPLAHCDALKDFVTKGMSYTDAANAINARFGTAYSRNAALGRAWRMGLAEVERPKPALAVPEPEFRQVTRLDLDEFALLRRLRRRPAFSRLKGVRLRCVEIVPRHFELIELEAGDCRYPYGGDGEGEAITFCGHPRRKGSSYCTPHFHLTRNPDVPAERPRSVAPLRLVAAGGNFKVEAVRNGTQEAPQGIRPVKCI
jgi:GcrA cell cycle regulator